eukprot:TRINITY_DN3261_c0_g1_i1.p1 TRINITY_DN3261_c0_g1~~TRINITY_DN3261_c0_g1_i1.p1  ORF type:complete len:105 (-),score=2.70 TRINITY_DN3261_c0_g1_i1:51-365(-)
MMRSNGEGNMNAELWPDLNHWRQTKMHIHQLCVRPAWHKWSHIPSPEHMWQIGWIQMNVTELRLQTNKDTELHIQSLHYPLHFTLSLPKEYSSYLLPGDGIILL